MSCNAFWHFMNFCTRNKDKNLTETLFTEIIRNSLNPSKENESEWNWFMQTSDIELGGSSVLGGNYLNFWVIHGVAITFLATSVLSSVAVIVSILWGVWRNRRQKGQSNGKRHRMEFADRFPLYLAVGDALFSVSHFVDHFYLATTLRYPSNPNVSLFLSIYLWIFILYHQCLHAGLAICTYMRVVRGAEMNLGKGEWKLHGISVALIVSTIAVFYPLDAFGPSGYWMLQNVRTTGGKAFGWYTALTGIALALCITLCYRQIKGLVEKQKMVLSQHRTGGHHSTASECLTTFVFVAMAFYCPYAVLNLAFVVETMFGVIEPLTCLLIVIIANSCGWANALGYWHNLRVKAKSARRGSKDDKLGVVTNSTGYNSTGSGRSKHSNTN